MSLLGYILLTQRLKKQHTNALHLIQGFIKPIAQLGPAALLQFQVQQVCLLNSIDRSLVFSLVL